MNTIIQQFDNLLDAIQSVLMSILVKIGPFFVALCPASFTAYAIYRTFAFEAGHTLALFFAVVVGVAWEAVGIISTHTATDLYNAWQDGKTQPVKFWVMVCLIPVYVLGVALVVGFSQDAFTPLVKGLGVSSPFLTVVVYIAVALARDIHRTYAKQEQVEDKQAQLEVEGLAWQREKELKEMELKHAEKLARIEAKSVSRTVSKLSQDDTLNVSRLSQTEIMERILRHLETDGDTAMTHLAETLGISRSTLYRRIDELQDAGKLHKNGSGWEVRR